MENGFQMSALAKRRAGIMARKAELDLEYKRRISECDEELKRIDDAIAVIDKAIAEFLCPDCKGSGIKRYCDAAGDMDDMPCPTCKGTGIRID